MLSHNDWESAGKGRKGLGGDGLGRLRATDHHPARVIPACSGRAAIVEDFGVFQHSAEHGVGVRAVPGERFVRNDEEVGGEVEMVGDGAVDGVASAGWFDDLDVSPAIAGPRPSAA